MPELARQYGACCVRSPYVFIHGVCAPKSASDWLRKQYVQKVLAHAGVGPGLPDVGRGSFCVLERQEDVQWGGAEEHRGVALLDTSVNAYREQHRARKRAGVHGPVE